MQKETIIIAMILGIWILFIVAFIFGINNLMELREKVINAKKDLLKTGFMVLDGCINGTINCTKKDIALLAFRLGSL